MRVEYRTKKDLPCNELYQLFLAAGWAKEDETTQAMIDNFNIGFINSTFVFSAWIDERLVGCVRVLSDLHFCETGERNLKYCWIAEEEIY